MDLATDLFPVGIGNGKDLGIGDTVDIDRGPGIVIKRAVVGGPPGGHGELEDVHPGLIIDIKGFQAAGQDKVFLFDLISFAHDDLAFFEGMLPKVGHEIVYLFLGEGDIFGDVLFQDLSFVQLSNGFVKDLLKVTDFINKYNRGISHFRCHFSCFGTNYYLLEYDCPFQTFLFSYFA